MAAAAAAKQASENLEVMFSVCEGISPRVPHSLWISSCASFTSLYLDHDTVLRWVRGDLPVIIVVARSIVGLDAEEEL